MKSGVKKAVGYSTGTYVVGAIAVAVSAYYVIKYFFSGENVSSEDSKQQDNTKSKSVDQIRQEQQSLFDKYNEEKKLQKKREELEEIKRKYGLDQVPENLSKEEVQEWYAKQHSLAKEIMEQEKSGNTSHSFGFQNEIEEKDFEQFEAHGNKSSSHNPDLDEKFNGQTGFDHAASSSRVPSYKNTSHVDHQNNTYNFGAGNVNTTPSFQTDYTRESNNSWGGSEDRTFPTQTTSQSNIQYLSSQHNTHPNTMHFTQQEDFGNSSFWQNPFTWDGKGNDSVGLGGQESDNDFDPNDLE